MDANGQRFWIALGGGPWTPALPGSLDLNPRRLQLASQSLAVDYPEQPAEAEDRLLRVPGAHDAFGTRAFVDPDGITIRATGAFASEEDPGTDPVLLVLAEPATDLALGFDGILYVVSGGSIRLHPLGSRFSSKVVSAPAFAAWRIAAAPGGGAWALDRTNRKLARLAGVLLPDPPAFIEPPPTAFQPSEDNPDPPRIEAAHGGWLEAGEDPVAIACGPDGRPTVLIWSASGARVRRIDDPSRPGPTAILRGVEKPFSLAWISSELFAVLAAGVPEAVVYRWLEGEIFPVGEVYPLRNHDGGPFLHGTSLPIEYLSAGDGAPPGKPEPRPLAAVSLPAFPKSAIGILEEPFDSGSAGTAWHRIYMDAVIPPGTSFTIHAAASDKAGDIPGADDWHPHHFGAVDGAAKYEPHGSWAPFPSEIPGRPGFADAPSTRDQSGLFTVLLQRANRPVRTLLGRFLHLKAELRGDLRSTPCIHALRAYAPRFSYQDRYLPALYRESLFGPDADAVSPGGPSTPADFLGRFLANFEGILTPLEDRISESWMLTDARSVPEDAIEWLGSWIGVAFEPWYPAARRREHLRQAPELFAWRGTLRGLRLALDVATGGGVSAGRIVVVEDHWFRRTLQTVLGIQLDRDFDALLGGPLITGNSKIGRTLFLSEEGMQQKFLALFDAAIELKAADRKVVEDFFASLAHRVTVIVHEETQPGELQLISRVASIEAPAHLIIRVRSAAGDFMIGLSALLGVDTNLRPHPRAAPAEIGISQSAATTIIGGGATLLRPPSLDPRLEGA